jgi:hypothetical protein
VLFDEAKHLVSGKGWRGVGGRREAEIRIKITITIKRGSSGIVLETAAAMRGWGGDAGGKVGATRASDVRARVCVRDCPWWWSADHKNRRIDGLSHVDHCIVYAKIAADTIQVLSWYQKKSLMAIGENTGRGVRRNTAGLFFS